MQKIIIAACGALILSGAAFARDVKMVLPVGPVLAHPETVKALGGMRVSFGAPPQAQRGTVNEADELKAFSWARPHDTRSFNTGQQVDGRPVYLNDTQMCQLALRYALTNLVEDARRLGAAAVVDVVSMNGYAEHNSPAEFECHAGLSSSTVDLRGRAAKAP